MKIYKDETGKIVLDGENNTSINSTSKSPVTVDESVTSDDLTIVNTHIVREA